MKKGEERGKKTKSEMNQEKFCHKSREEIWEK